MANKKNQNRIFHVHTYRCAHAENVSDEAYVQKALELGAEEIWFTDHAPFPGDPLRSRMRHEQLDEYLATLSTLKERYGGLVHIGLEIEYFPSFDRQGYYEELLADKRLEVLALGQHIAEDAYGSFTFSWGKERLAQEEYLVLGDAMCEGLRKGYFGVLVHPDRIFRKQKTWTGDMQRMADKIIWAATEKHVPIELNMHSVAVKRHYWPEFWNTLLPESKIIIGLDAHSISHLERRFERGRQWFERLEREWLAGEIPVIHERQPNRYDRNEIENLLNDAFVRSAARTDKTESRHTDQSKDDPRA